MSKAKWPREAQLFQLKRSTNSHWRKSDIVELLNVEPSRNSLGVRDFNVRHYCRDGVHDGWAFSLDDFHPLTETARAMLAIAKAGAR